MNYMADGGGGRSMGPYEKALWMGAFFAAPDNISTAQQAVEGGRQELLVVADLIAEFKRQLANVWQDNAGSAAGTASATLVAALEEKTANLAAAVDSLYVAVETITKAQDKYSTAPVPYPPLLNEPKPPPEGITLDYIRAQTAYTTAWNSYKAAVSAREELMKAYYTDLQTGLISAGQSLATSLGIPIPDVADPGTTTTETPSPLTTQSLSLIHI